MDKHRFNKMPEMRPDDYNALLESLRLFGYDENYPVIFYENEILDGWNRYRACQELSIPYTEKYFIGTYEEAVEFVHRTNTRRNLTPNEQAELIGRYYEDIKMAVGNPQLGHIDHINEMPTNIDVETVGEIDEPVYEMDEFSQVQSPRASIPSRKKAAHTYGVSESKVKRAVEYTRALDQVSETIQKDARAGKVSQAEVIRTADGKPKPAPKPFEKIVIKRKIGAIAFEIEALAHSFPNTREVCDKILELCRKAQTYTGV